MQKLVKKTRHYQTMVPVEAYHEEDDTWQDEISLALTVAGGVLAWSNPWVGAAIAGAGVINHFFHDEIVDAVEVMAEAEVERLRIEQANHDAMHQAIDTYVEAIADGIESLGDALENDDNLPGSGGVYQPFRNH